MINFSERVKGCGSRIWYKRFDTVIDSDLLTLRASQEPEDLFETISQALLNAVDRDALSGWGAHVYIIEKDKVTKRLLKGRQD